MKNQTKGVNFEEEIRQLFESDQADREQFSQNPTIGPEVNRRDQQRLKKAKEILENYQPSNPHLLNMLAFIFQHGVTVNDYRTALELATKAVENGLPPQHSLIPKATDRLMLQEQVEKGVPLNRLKQKYGTQVRWDEKGNSFTPPLDGTVTKEELKKFGLK